jgi:hypothetical protein
MDSGAIRTAGDFRCWLLEAIQMLTTWGNSEPDEAVFESAADIVREAGEISLRFGLPDLYRECQVASPMLAIRTAKESLGRCLAECNQLNVVSSISLEAEATKASNGADKLGKRPELSFIYERAYSQFLSVEEVHGQVTDQEAYEYVKQREEQERSGEVLLPYETWKRYLRVARHHYGTQKNSPRGGRSIVSIHDIEASKDNEEGDFD